MHSCSPPLFLPTYFLAQMISGIITFDLRMPLGPWRAEPTLLTSRPGMYSHFLHTATLVVFMMLWKFRALSPVQRGTYQPDLHRLENWYSLCCCRWNEGCICVLTTLSNLFVCTTPRSSSTKPGGCTGFRKHHSPLSSLLPKLRWRAKGPTRFTLFHRFRWKRHPTRLTGRLPHHRQLVYVD